MSISFTGYKNVGATYLKDDVFEYAHINLELTNKGQKDLDNFEPIIKKHANNVNKNFLDMKYIRNDAVAPLTPIFMINDRILPISDENLSTFSKVGQLIRRIWNDDNQIHTSKDYLESPACEYVFSVDIPRDAVTEDYLENFHTNESAKAGAKKLDELIEKEMIDYFA